MGAWGTGLFDDDETADLRADYRTFLADARTDEGASDLAAKNYEANFDNPSDTTAFWLALGALVHRAGRLDPRVKAVALSEITNGSRHLPSVPVDGWSASGRGQKETRAGDHRIELSRLDCFAGCFANAFSRAHPSTYYLETAKRRAFNVVAAHSANRTVRLVKRTLYDTRLRPAHRRDVHTAPSIRTGSLRGEP